MLKNEGMPVFGDDNRGRYGNMLVTIEIEFPAVLSAQVQHLIEDALRLRHHPERPIPSHADAWVEDFSNFAKL